MEGASQAVRTLRTSSLILGNRVIVSWLATRAVPEASTGRFLTRRGTAWFSTGLRNGMPFPASCWRARRGGTQPTGAGIILVVIFDLPKK